MRHLIRRDAVLVLLVGALTLTALVPTAGADPGTDVHIVDPEGDTQHREFGWEEPTLDVTKVSFNWTDEGELEVSVLLPNADTLGPEGTTDPFPGHWTVVDVYWTTDGSGHLARALWKPGEDATFHAGQGIRIGREAVWETGTDIHGETTEQDGWVEPVGDGHRVTIVVDPADVGAPGPGDLLEAPAFSSYIDHHTPLGEDWPVPHPFGPHHPSNADLNDEPGLHFEVPGADDAGEAGAETAGGRTVPGPGAWIVVAAIAGAGLAVRRRR